MRVICKNLVVNSIVLRDNILVIVLNRLLFSRCHVHVKSILRVGPKVNDSIEDPFK
jgi:hypothetical protein